MKPENLSSHQIPSRLLSTSGKEDKDGKHGLKTGLKIGMSKEVLPGPESLRRLLDDAKFISGPCLFQVKPIGE